MRLTGPPTSEELRVRRRAFVVDNVLSLAAAAEDFSDDKNIRRGNERR
jgi:hypothetical protein